MLTIYDAAGGGLVKREARTAITNATVWIDLLNPTSEEDGTVETALGIAIPTRAEMREIEASNRLYNETGAHFMTAFIVYNVEAQIPSFTAVTFILVGHRLVTVRYAEPRAFPIFLQRVDKGDAACGSGAVIMIGLLEALIHRKADLIERNQDEVDGLAPAIFDIKGGQQTRNRRFDVILKNLGKQGDITSRSQESAVSLERLLTYFAAAARERGEDKRLLQRIETARRDIHSLMEHMRFLLGRINFLLDATLGMITTEQNQIIKLFSVMAVVLLPPTLIASIYGMNFKFMPELDWILGYPLALGLMIVSGLVPYVYFRRKGWL